MSGIRGTNTKPELVLRRGLHALGFRFRLHDRNLAGTPDIVLPRYRAVIFAHGCFWHGHDCHLFRLPATRPDFWAGKIERNRQVDERSLESLRKAGWRVATVWECALKGRSRLPLESVMLTLADWLRSGEPELTFRGTDGTCGEGSSPTTSRVSQPSG